MTFFSTLTTIEREGLDTSYNGPVEFFEQLEKIDRKCCNFFFFFSTLRSILSCFPLKELPQVVVAFEAFDLFTPLVHLFSIKNCDFASGITSAINDR